MTSAILPPDNYDSIPIPVVIKTRNGTLVYRNKAARVTGTLNEVNYIIHSAQITPELVLYTFTPNTNIQLGRYEAEFDEIEYLGKGGFGSVFKSLNKLDGI